MARKLQHLALRVLGILFMPVLFLVSLVSGILSKPLPRTHSDVAALLRRRLAGTQDRGEWDDFVCRPIADFQLEAMRRSCVNIEEKESIGTPPSYLTDAGHRQLTALINELDGVEQNLAR